MTRLQKVLVALIIAYSAILVGSLLWLLVQMVKGIG